MKTINTDIYPFTLCIAEIAELDEVTKTFVDANMSEIVFPKDAAGLTVRALYRKTGKFCSLIIVNKEVSNIGTLAHEAFHATTDLFENIGILHDNNNSSIDEVYAYVVGFITQKIYDVIWE